MWQSLLIVCAIACTNAHSEKSVFSDSLNFQSIHESSFSKTLLKLLQSPDVQHYVSQIPIWKLQAVLDALSRHMVLEQYRLKSQTRYNRLFKRALDPDTFMINFKEAIREAVREILAEKDASKSRMADHWSRVDKDTGTVTSDAQANFLRSIGFHAEDKISDFGPQLSLEYENSEHAQGLQIESRTVGSISTSKPGGTSLGSEEHLTEQVSLRPQTLLQQSVTTLPTTQNIIYSNTINTLSQTSTRVTTVSSSGTSSRSRLLTSSDSQSSTKQKSTKLITKHPRFLTNPVFRRSTLGKSLTSSIKTSAAKLGSTRFPITENTSGMVNLTGMMAAELFSSDRNTSSPSKPSIPQNDHTSSPISFSASLYTKYDLASRTLHMPRLSILPTTSKTFGTFESYKSNDKFTDAYQITSTKEKEIPSSNIEVTSIATIKSSVMAIKSDFPGTQVSYSHKSADARTSAGLFSFPSNTAKTSLSLPLSSPKQYSPLDDQETEAAPFETTNNLLSTGTQLPIMGRDNEACELKVRNITTMPTPLMEYTSYENESMVYSTRIKASLKAKSEKPFTGMLAPPDIPSSGTLSTFTESYSSNSTAFTESYSSNSTEESSPVHLVLANGHSLIPTELEPSAFSSLTVAFTASPTSTDLSNTETVTISENEIFYDAMPEDVNLSQMPPNVTSTINSTVSPFWLSKLISKMPPWETGSPGKVNGSVEKTERSNSTLGKIRFRARTPNFHTPGFWSTQTAAISRGSSIFTKSPESSYSSAHISQGQGILGTTNVKPRFFQSITSISPTNLSFALLLQSRNHSITKALRSANTTEMFTSTIQKLQFSVVPSESTPAIDAERSVTPQTVTNIQSYNISTKQHKFSLFSLNIASQSQDLSTTPSAVSQSANSTAINVLFTLSQLRNKTTAGPRSSSTSFNTAKRSTNIGKNTSFVAPSKYTSGSQSSDIFTTPNPSIFSLTPIAQQSKDILNTHVKSTPQSHTSALKPLFAGSVTSTSFTRKSVEESAPGFKVPLDVLAEKSTTPMIAISKGIPEILTTLQVTSSSTKAVVSVPLTFHLTGVSYTEQLSDQSTDEYKRLEREVTLVLNKVFASKYQQFVQVEILGFSKGSIVVKSKILFGSSSSSPSSSDVVRTVLSDNTATKNTVFGWKIDASTLDSSGFTPVNLAPESLSIYFVVLHFGFIAVSQNYQEKHNYLENLQKEMLYAVNKSIPVTNISFLHIRNLHGDLEVRGDLFLKSRTFTNVQAVLPTLLPLANESVDLRSIAVDGIRNDLKVYPFNFRVTNQQFFVKLLDMASTESQKLSKDLSNVIKLALKDNSLLQVVIREFYSGSVACKGDLIYGFPAPGSREVLHQFLQARTSGDMLGSSSYKVDFQSVTIGDSTSSPFNEYTHFPGFGVAIIVMCGLSILISPVLAFVCYKTRMLGHRQKATIRQRHDPDRQSHHFEMDNRAFRASIEQP